MQIAMVGLGRMGANMARRLMRGGHTVVAYDRDPAVVKSFSAEGSTGVASLSDLVKSLSAPRTVWIMVPAGTPTEATVNELGGLLSSGDAIIDGGNSYFKDDVRRGAALKAKGIAYVDAGTSGGVWGLERGYCLMVGGEKPVIDRLAPIFKTLAPGRGDTPPSPGYKNEGTAADGWLHCGPTGSGHFVKMIHNGIEYGLMQAYAEGFDILKNANSSELPEAHRFNIPVGDVAELWRRGSVVGSWLLDLSAMALTEDPTLEKYEGFVADSGEGRWTVQAALEASVPAEVLTASLFARFRSRQKHTFAEKLLSAMREKFGGHKEPAKAGAK
jgi:6-phosphogluconate dehydrogenase